MCGIFGFNFENKELLKKMGSALERRGPDGGGHYSDSDVSLGHRRLKIIDLSENAKQPMTNEDGGVWLVYNGETYNFKGIRKELESLGHEFKSGTDSEVIVHGYEEWDRRVIDRLRGIFAFAIYDSSKKRLLLARDRIGVKPLYYHFDGDRFIFASEIKAILNDVPPHLNLGALDEFFTFQYTLCPKTLFSGIKKLKPGHFMEFDLRKKTIKESPYWNLNPAIIYKSERYFIKKIEEKIKESIKLRLISDVPLGIYLSGGLDSSYVAAVAKELKDDVKAYTVSFSGEDEDESGFASMAAGHLGIDHRVIPVEAGQVELIPEVTWHLDKPAVDIASVPLHVMAKASKKYLTVALMGDGGDEIFAGYEKYRLMKMREKAKLLPEPFRLPLSRLLPVKKENKERLKGFLVNNDAAAYLSYVSSFSLDERKELFTRDFSQEQLGRVGQYFNKNPRNPLQAAFVFDIKTLLPDDYLMKVDKATMANAIEARVPYLDHELVELAMTIPPEYKIKGLKTKAFFRKVVKRKLPEKIVERKKHGFNVPTRRWLDAGLDEIAYQLIDTAPDIINRESARRIIKNFKNNPRYYSRQFWTIFTFILWYKMYFETETPGFDKTPRFDIDYYVS